MLLELVTEFEIIVLVALIVPGGLSATLCVMVVMNCNELEVFVSLELASTEVAELITVLLDDTEALL